MLSSLFVSLDGSSSSSSTPPSSAQAVFSDSKQAALKTKQLEHRAVLKSKDREDEDPHRASLAKELEASVSAFGSEAAAKVVRDKGVAVVSPSPGTSIFSAAFLSALHAATEVVEGEITCELERQKINFRRTPSNPYPPPSSCVFKFSEVSARCVGRLDVRHRMGEYPFSDPAFVSNPSILKIVRELLGDDAVLTYAGLILSFPDSDDQPFHMDGPDLFPDNPTLCSTLPPHSLNVFVPVHDLNLSHGPTEFFVGSHSGPSFSLAQSSVSRCQKTSVTIKPLLKAGQLLVYDYRTTHRGTANRGSTTRKMLYLMYSRPWFKEHLNFGDDRLFKHSQSTMLPLPVKSRGGAEVGSDDAAGAASASGERGEVKKKARTKS